MREAVKNVLLHLQQAEQFLVMRDFFRTQHGDCAECPGWAREDEAGVLAALRRLLALRPALLEQSQSSSGAEQKGGTDHGVCVGGCV